jgi:SAM-dependent methyltransferase
MRADDPVTGRRFLTRSAYADDRHLRARMGIWAYAEARPDPGWRLAAVPWDGTQVVADVGCGNGFDLRQLVPGGRCGHAVGIDLSAGMLRGLAELAQAGGLSLVQADAQQLPLGDGSVDVALAMHMLYHVPDVGAAVAELRRITRPGGTVLASTNSPDSMAEVHELFDAAASGLLGRPVRALPPLSFTTETGAAVLAGQFSDVTLCRHDVPVAFPSAEPVVAYLSSIRAPVLAYAGERFPFDAALAELAVRVEEAIRAQGRFRATSRSGVFVCRQADSADG